jgi:hypothetical protein
MADKSANDRSKNPNEPERPRSEPEIIPPDHGRGPNRRGPNDPGQSWPPYGFTQTRNTHRVYVSRIGPFGFALIMLVVGFLAAILLLILIGAALIWIPVVAVFIVIAAVSGLLRRR